MFNYMIFVINDADTTIELYPSDTCLDTSCFIRSCVYKVRFKRDIKT